MKTIQQIVAEKPLGTEFVTEEVFPEASEFTKTMLGKKFRCVRTVHVIECEDGGNITLEGTLPGFKPVDDDEEDCDEEDDEEF